jgi:hypothetical protein
LMDADWKPGSVPWFTVPCPLASLLMPTPSTQASEPLVREELDPHLNCSRGLYAPAFQELRRWNSQGAFRDLRSSRPKSPPKVCRAFPRSIPEDHACQERTSIHAWRSKNYGRKSRGIRRDRPSGRRMKSGLNSKSGSRWIPRDRSDRNSWNAPRHRNVPWLSQTD